MMTVVMKIIQKEKQRREKSMDSLNAEFDKEVYKIREMQRSLQARQKIMARLAVELYSCILIQSRFRSFLAMRLLHRLRSKRFLLDWLKFHLCYRWPRRRAAAHIIRFYRSRKTQHLMSVVEKLQRAANKIKMWFRKRLRAYKLKGQIELLICRTRVVNRAFVFGTTRAANKIRVKRIEAKDRSPKRLHAAKVLTRF